MTHDLAEKAAASARSHIFVAICGAVTAIAAQLNWASSYAPAYDGEPVGNMLAMRLAIAAIGGPVGFLALRRVLRSLALGSAATDAAKARYLGRDHSVYIVGLLACAGAVGIRMGGEIVGLIAALFIIGQLLLLLAPTRADDAPSLRPMLTLSVLFMLSGFAALIYQVSWQRALFTAFGVNIESITVVVSIFMFGLGVGALVGGRLSARYPDKLPALFLVAEVGIAAFGFASLGLIAAVSGIAVNASLPVITLAIYALLALPTLCMGATLPILVAHVHTWYGHIGKSVGLLYFVNTVGSAIACWMTTDVLFVVGGLQSSVTFAALCNVVVGVSVYLFMVRGNTESAAGGA